MDNDQINKALGPIRQLAQEGVLRDAVGRIGTMSDTLMGELDQLADHDVWRQEVLRVFDQIKEHKVPYDIEIDGLKLGVRPNVFSPKYFTDSFWFARAVSKMVGDSSFLEAGTGTGIVSLLCARNGADVTATDISVDSVVCARNNFQRNLLMANILHTDVFDDVEGEFNYIFWNHPFNDSQPPSDEMLYRAGFDPNYQGLRKYFAQAPNLLNGKLLLGTGSGANLELMYQIANAAGYTPVLADMMQSPLTEGSEVPNDYRIYEFNMTPERYFKLLAECSDNDLTDKAGVYSNWPIVTSADFATLKDIVCGGNAWETNVDMGDERHVYHKSLPVQARILDLAREMDLSDVPIGVRGKMQSTVILFPHHESESSLDQDRSLAMVIETLGESMMRRSTSFCFPESKGWDRPEDHSRVVVYDG